MGQPVAIGPPSQPDRTRVLHPQYLTSILHFRERIIRAGYGPQSVARQRQTQPYPACLARAGENLIVERLVG